MKAGDIILIPAKVVRVNAKHIVYAHSGREFESDFESSLVDRVTIGATPYDTIHRCTNGGTWPLCLPNDN